MKSMIIRMRRAFSVASLGLGFAGLLALAGCVALAPAALAQHGGGGHGGGFGGGHAGGFGGGFGGGHSFGGGFSSHSFGGGYSGSFGRSPSFGSFRGPRGYSYAPRMTYPAPSRAFATPGRQGYGMANRSGYGGRDRYRSPYRGYGPGYGYGYPGYSWGVLPWELGYPDFYGYGDSSWVGQSDSGGAQQDQGYNDPGYGPSYGAGEDPGPQDAYRAPYGDPSGSATAAPLAGEPALTLVFNDGHQQAIHNYALTSNYILVLNDDGSGRAQRIPLADLNVPATERAAQSAGLDFAPPPSGAPASF
jgi:hypothetical protein